MRDWLLLGLEYDLWANRRWLPILEAEGGIRLGILMHIIQSQGRWLDRCGVRVSAEAESWDALLLSHHEALLRLAQKRELGDAVSYVDSNGTRHVRKVEEILLHVINHGTYHRGQIRGMEENPERIPETDLTRFLNERDGRK